jgi:hypothetical protein
LTIKIFPTLFVIRELGFGVIVVNGFDHRCDHFRGRMRLAARRHLLQRMSQLFPCLARPGRDAHRHQQFPEAEFNAARGCRGCIPRIVAFDREWRRLLLHRNDELGPKLLRRPCADSREQPDHPFERHFVARIHHKLQKSRHIFHVRLLEKTQSARDLKRNPVPRELHLEFHGVVVRPVQHRDILQVHPFLV